MEGTRIFDFIVIGAGIAGVSCGCELAARGRVVVLEREKAPGTQTTRQSAAQFIASYGGPEVQPLNMISRDFFENPPPNFCESSILTPRPLLYIAHESERDQLEGLMPEIGAYVRRGESDEILERVPILRPEHAVTGLWEDDACDIDVNALLQAYLCAMKARDGELVLDAAIQSIDRDCGRWVVDTDRGRFAGAVIVNAAGAWADEVAELAGVAALGLEPKRRSAYNVKVPDGDARFKDLLKWPCVYNVSANRKENEKEFYFKPEGGQLMMSPANVNPSRPIRDIQPEEEDGGAVMERFNAATTYQVHRFFSRRAGLRTFTPDGAPAIGFDGQSAGFFWFAGQGGFGIQSAPAAAQLAAALASQAPLPDAFGGLDHERLSPKRFRRSS